MSNLARGKPLQKGPLEKLKNLKKLTLEMAHKSIIQISWNAIFLFRMLKRSIFV